MSEAISVNHSAGGIVTVSLDRPRVHNAFDDELIATLTEVLTDIEHDESVRAVVLAASGESFSAGADLNWMRRMADYDRSQNVHDADALATLLDVLDNLARPTVARIQGAAYGGGVGLVACCDIAVASERAAFALSEVRLGLIPSVIGPYVVNAVGARAARRYFLTGERFDAQQAYRIGLVHQVVPHAALDTAVASVLDELGRGGPSAQAAAKRLIAHVAGRPIDAQLRNYTAERIAEIRASVEGTEGLDAFLNKRAPAWHDNADD